MSQDLGVLFETLKAISINLVIMGLLEYLISFTQRFVLYFTGSSCAGTIEFVTESMETVHLIKEANTKYHIHGNEIKTRQKRIQGDWEVTMERSYQEANQCADFLAKLRARSGYSLKSFH